MEINVKCLECSLHSFITLMEDCGMSVPDQEKLTRQFLKYLAEIDYTQSPPAISKYIHQEIKKYLNTHDPYFEKKNYFNNLLSKQYDRFYELVNQSENPFYSAIQLAISGNIIDFGPNQKFDMEGVIDKALHTPIQWDESKALLDNLHKSHSILYLTDNSGEIVFDKLLLQYLIEKENLPKEKITVATRGYPILNDATMEDAEKIGLTSMVKVIDNGDSAPGTILETASEEFNRYFKKADLVISKGQGNYETLNQMTDKNIFFLLIAKCPLVAKSVGVPKGSFICANSIREKS